MKASTTCLSAAPRTVLCQHNDHRWDVSHRHSGGAAVSSPRSQRRKHAQMGESQLSAPPPSVTNIASIISTSCSAILSNISSICWSYLLYSLLVSFLSPPVLLACESSSSVSLPELTAHRLQPECVSKHSVYVGGCEKMHHASFFFSLFCFVVFLTKVNMWKKISTD